MQHERQDSCLKDRERGLPGGAVVNTLPFHVGDVEVRPLVGKLRFYMPCSQKLKKRKKRREKVSPRTLKLRAFFFLIPFSLNLSWCLLVGHSVILGSDK